MADQIRKSLSEIEQAVERVRRQFEEAPQTDERGELDSVARELESFYATVECVFEDIARFLEEGVPTGPDRSRILLLQMSAEIEDVRPAVIRRETRLCLDAYRRFCEDLRAPNSFELDPERLEELVGDLPSCQRAVNRDLRTFAYFIEDLPFIR